MIDGIDWRAGLRKGMLWLIADGAAVPGRAEGRAADLDAASRSSTSRVSGLSNTAQWLLALIAALVLIYFIYDRIVALGWDQSCASHRG